MTSLRLLLTDKPAIAPPVFVFQKDKAQKVSFSVTKVFVKIETIHTLFIIKSCTHTA